MEANTATATRVVIVDDDADVRELVSRYLTMQGIVVEQASGEAELLAHLAAAPLQVALLDVNLGREDGFDIARRLRAHAYHKQHVARHRHSERGDVARCGDQLFRPQDARAWP